MWKGVWSQLGWPAPSFFACRKLAAGVCCLCLGIAATRAAMLDGALQALGVALPALVVLAFLLRKRRKLPQIACFLLGSALCAAALWTPGLPPVGSWTVEGTVCSQVKTYEKAAGCLLRDVTIHTEDGEAYELPGTLSCYLAEDGETGLTFGQRVRATGKGYALRGQRNPGGENERLTLAASGAHMRFYGSEPVVVTGEAAFSLRGLAIWVNDALGARMDALFGAASPVLRAVLLGDTDAMPQAWMDWMRLSGIAHVLAVSGLHVALWFALLQRMIGRLHLPPGARLAALTVLLAAYSLLTGLRDSAVRASVMLLIMEGVRVRRRNPDPVTSLAAAAGVILVFRPLDLFAPGFRLSFGAMLGLILIGPKTLRRKDRTFLRILRHDMAVSAAAQLGALVPAAACFGMVSPIGLLTNLLVIPLLGLLVPFGAVAVMLDVLLPVLAVIPAAIARGLAAMMLLIASFGAETPLSTLRIPAFAPWTAAAFYAGLFLCSSAVIWRARVRAGACAALIVCALLCGLVFSEPAVFYDQLDVGESLCGVLHVNGKRYVYDCGEDGRELSGYLRRYGGGVETVVLSHPHADHFAGLAALLEDGIEIGRICIPARAGVFGKDAEYDELLNLAEKAGIRIVELSAGDVLYADGLTVQVLAPEESAAVGSGPNDRSLVLRAEVNGWSLLLTGDADGATEPHGVPCDILQVAHHGSANASNIKAMEGMKPRIAVISCGESRYHPDAETVKRLEDAGVSVYATRETGALRIALLEDRLEVTGFCR